MKLGISTYPDVNIWDLFSQNQDKVARNTWWFLSVFWVFEGFLSPSPFPSGWYSRLCPGFVGARLILK